MDHHVKTVVRAFQVIQQTNFFAAAFLVCIFELIYCQITRFLTQKFN